MENGERRRETRRGKAEPRGVGGGHSRTTVLEEWKYHEIPGTQESQRGAWAYWRVRTAPWNSTNPLDGSIINPLFVTPRAGSFMWLMVHFHFGTPASRGPLRKDRRGGSSVQLVWRTVALTTNLPPKLRPLIDRGEYFACFSRG